MSYLFKVIYQIIFTLFMKNHIPSATVEIKNYTAHESSGKSAANQRTAANKPG